MSRLVVSSIRTAAECFVAKVPGPHDRPTAVPIAGCMVAAMEMLLDDGLAGTETYRHLGAAVDAMMIEGVIWFK